MTFKAVVVSVSDRDTSRTLCNAPRNYRDRKKAPALDKLNASRRETGGAIVFAFRGRDGGEEAS